MAKSQYPNDYSDRPERTRERENEWRQGRNDKYQAQGWKPDTERDSSLGEYYPTDNYYEGGSDFIDRNYVTGGRMPRSLSENQRPAYGNDYRDRESGSSYGQRDRGYEPYSNRQPEYGGGRTEYRDHPPSEPNYGSAYAENYANFGREVNHRGRGPKGYTRSDDRIREDVCEQLSDDPLIDASDVTVNVSQGAVTLEGSVENRSMKHRIEDIVADCSGVKDVHNRLLVAANRGDWTNDSVSHGTKGAGAKSDGSKSANK